MAVFKNMSLMNRTFLQKLFNKYPFQNFIIELENYLSENEDNIGSISQNVITSLLQKYRVNFIKSYQQSITNINVGKNLRENLLFVYGKYSKRSCYFFFPLLRIFVNNVGASRRADSTVLSALSAAGRSCFLYASSGFSLS